MKKIPKNIIYTVIILITILAIPGINNVYGQNNEEIFIRNGSRNKKYLALTFDDGPHPKETNEVLDVLKKYNVKATFFIAGKHANWYSEPLIRASKEGHEIGNHTFTHINVEKNSENIILKEIEKTQQAIKDVIGIEPVLFRPPYRAISRPMFEIVKSKDMKVVLWSDLDARDWSNPGVYNIVKTIEEKAHNGSIVLLHDYNTIRNSKSQTIQALEQIIPEMQSKGYKFVTVSEIIEDKATETEKR